MISSRRAKLFLIVAMAIGLAIIYVPLLMVVLNSFNSDKAFGWPPGGFTGKWWSEAVGNSGVRSALWTSVKVGLGATAIALVLGTLASFAVQRYRFFGRETVSLLIILPIALPGIVTAIALNNAFREVLHLSLGLMSIVVGHATFCIVTVYNNVLARLRRMGTSVDDASADLGADTFQTFRYVTFPLLRPALLAGALLAFALSFDEIIVTTFTAGAGVQTLPLWIFTNLSRPNQAPIVNVVAAALVVISIVPIYLAQRLSGEAKGY